MNIQIDNRWRGLDGNRRRIHIGRWSLPWPFPLFDLIGSASIVFGWPVFGGNAPRYVRHVHNIACRIRDAKLWVYYRIHPGYRFHIVKTGLEPGYWDVDTVMLHACMSLLCQHVEESCNGPEALAKFSAELRESDEPEPVAGATDSQADRQDEMIAIYHWWKVQRPADEARETAMSKALYSGASPFKFTPNEDETMYEMTMDDESADRETQREALWALQEKIRDDTQAMLHRLIDIRESLWD